MKNYKLSASKQDKVIVLQFCRSEKSRCWQGLLSFLETLEKNPFPCFFSASRGCLSWYPSIFKANNIAIFLKLFQSSHLSLNKAGSFSSLLRTHVIILNAFRWFRTISASQGLHPKVTCAKSLLPCQVTFIGFKD